MHREISHAGYPGLKGVGVHKLFELQLATTDESEALVQAEEITKKYLVNPRTEEHLVLGVTPESAS